MGLQYTRIASVFQDTDSYLEAIGLRLSSAAMLCAGFPSAHRAMLSLARIPDARPQVS